MIKILISSCLLGEPVRYDGAGAGATSAWLERWRDEGRLVPFCPEVAGGLPVPRPPMEIRGRGGAAVLRGAARVVAASGREETASFLAGARQALRTALDAGAGLAILKDGSPSCGSTYIYDGSFTSTRSPGRGVTTALLEENGIRVFSERQIGEAAACLARLPKPGDAEDRTSGGKGEGRR